MIGIIITGHGTFGTGIASAIELLTGRQDFLLPVDFEAEHSEEQLRSNLKAALEHFRNCRQILVLCDLLGGSPFKNAAILSLEDDRIKVLYGINLAMSVELAMRCMMDQTPDLDALPDELIKVGKAQIGKYKFEPVTIPEDADEGI
ncbi:PTS sugar transporter subunit IIA [Lachnospiraceae bacterium 54-53]